MTLFRRRHRDLDERVEDARGMAQNAEEQARLSRARQESVREHVVRPLREAARHNQFAEMIEASLRQGWSRP